MDVKYQCPRKIDTSNLCYANWVVRFVLWWVFKCFACVNLWKNKRNYDNDNFFYNNKSNIF